MRSIRIQTPDELHSQVEKALAASAHVFVLFFGREVPNTGNSWCPDCVIAEPHIRKQVSRLDNSVLIEYPVDRKTGGATTYWSSDKLNIRAIPTLVKCANPDGLTKEALVEDDCQDERNLAAFLGLDSRL
ncbi:hypothetical protein BJ085DRAFT_40367 [Dimargaris cristalligena]|uniref:Thioredoxin domain-containing protein n=1 Tax=Dimargaris cristalligena TaxID=215637 RepID=A0A4P9ZLA8_9FUNG|nr:hypothetical protein BJ085DRAFT_40367 [Dimargaris cristalligena]|eukprot:RKP33362.1 hypothetical protein BJ085DRAFT_40367 [Dimargaris cristalligena]